LENGAQVVPTAVEHQDMLRRAFLLKSLRRQMREHIAWNPEKMAIVENETGCEARVM
jgi:hypothetical protein